MNKVAVGVKGISPHGAFPDGCDERIVIREGEWVISLAGWRALAIERQLPGHILDVI